MPKFAVTALFWLCMSQAALAEPGIAAGSVRFAVFMPLSNLYAECGSAYMSGAKACAEDVNRQGGIYGRKLQLIAFDTVPMPCDTTAQATEALQAAAADEQVFAMLGSMGQPSAAALVPLLQSTGTALIGSATGLAAQIKESDGLIFPVCRRDKEVVQGLVRLPETMSTVRLFVVNPRPPDALLQMRSLQARAAGHKGGFVTHSDAGTLRLMAELKGLSRALPKLPGFILITVGAPSVACRPRPVFMSRHAMVALVNSVCLQERRKVT